MAHNGETNNQPNAVKENNNPETGTKIDLSGGGLHFRFHRDLAQKYTKYFRDRTPQSYGSSLNESSEWKVLGYFDFLKVTTFKKLEDLESEKNQDCLQCWRSSLDLALIPIKSKKHEEERNEGELDKTFVNFLVKPDDERPLLTIVKIILSPSLFDFDGSFDRIPKAIHYLAEKLEGILKKWNVNFKREFFTSLSGPDLVMVAFPETPKDFSTVENLVRETRCTELSDLEKHCRDPEQEPEQEWEGHACTSVTSMLAFREKSEGLFAKGSKFYSDEEKTVNYRFHFRLRLDSGHEDTVIRNIWDHFKDEKWKKKKKTEAEKEAEEEAKKEEFFENTGGVELHSTWGHYSLEGSFKHLSEIISAWKTHWFNPEWREQHLIDSTTKMSFPLPKEEKKLCHTRQVWQLHGEVGTALDKIRDQLENFSSQFLNKRHAAELMNVYVNFRRCFFRHDLIGVARDLFPFFQQLGELFEDTTLWKEHLAAASNLKEFLEDMDRLLIHLNRAIKNRIEHRSMQSDPPMPHTIAHGACRVLIAHSAAFWLTTELFCREETTEKTVLGGINHFAGCVFSGSRGQVLCNEIFENFRDFLKEKAATEDENIDPESRKKYKKLAEKSLVTLDISGKSLLQPASFFVYCMHEMAELSDWITRANCSDLRRILKHHVRQHFSKFFQEQLWKETVEKNPSFENAENIETEAKEFAERYVSYSIALSIDSNIKSDDNVMKAIEKTCNDSSSPIDFARNGMPNALYETMDDKTTAIKNIQTIFGFAVPEIVANFIPKTLRSEEFQKKIDKLWSINAEVMADCGMWTALNHILSSNFSDDEPEETYDKMENLNRIFCGLVVAEQTTRPSNNGKLSPSLLYRWAIQAAALCENNEEWIDSIVASIIKYKESYPGTLENFVPKQIKKFFKQKIVDRFPLSFTEKNCLVNELRKLKAYGGTIEIPKYISISSSAFSSTERELFAAFKKAWRSFDHPDNPKDQIDFAMKLWIAASRFGFDEILTKTAV